MTPFFITGLPRSRTAWMAAYLTGGDVLCHHELMKFCKSKEEFYQSFRHPALRVGDSDSGLPDTEFQKIFPRAPTIIIERPLDDVLQSLHDIEIPAPREYLEAMQAKLSRLNGMRVEFENLDRQMPDVCEYLGIPYSREKHDLFRSLVVVTVDFTPDNYLIWR